MKTSTSIMSLIKRFIEKESTTTQPLERLISQTPTATQVGEFDIVKQKKMYTVFRNKTTEHSFANKIVAVGYAKLYPININTLEYLRSIDQRMTRLKIEALMFKTACNKTGIDGETRQLNEIRFIEAKHSINICIASVDNCIKSNILAKYHNY